MSALHQMTMSYVAEEDRILFRLSTKDKKEYRMWLTRRFIGVLWGALGNTFAAKEDLVRITDNAVKDAVLGMKHQEAVQNTLCHLIVTTCQRAGWNLDLTLGDPNVVVPTGEALVH
jgi:hypothetical protein